MLTNLGIGAPGLPSDAVLPLIDRLWKLGDNPPHLGDLSLSETTPEQLALATPPPHTNSKTKNATNSYRETVDPRSDNEAGCKQPNTRAHSIKGEVGRSPI
ncbi:hypothetical protein ACLB2K_075725 [Fragaria x ananassa]